MSNTSLSRIMEKCCVVNNEIWYVNALINGLFKVDMETGKALYAGTPDQNEMYVRKAYLELIYCENMLYMIPYNASSIGIYDVLTGRFHKIFVSEETNEKFHEAVLIENKIYLLPYKANSFYCLDTSAKKLSEIKELKNINVSVLSSVKRDGEIWFAEDGGHNLYCFEPINGKLKQIVLDKERGHFSSVGKVGNKILITAIDKALVACVEPKTECMAYYEFEKYSSIKGERNYYIAEYGEKAILIRIGSNDCVVINIENGEIKEKAFLPGLSDGFGKICKMRHRLAMLPTVENRAFRFIDGRTIFLDDEEALSDWARSNGFRWEECKPIPDYGVEKLLQIINWYPAGKGGRKQQKNHIFETLKE